MPSSLGMLPPHSQAPVVTQATMSTDFIVQDVGHNLVRLTILHITLTIQEPIRDLVLARILHDGDNLLHFFLAQLSRSLGQRNVCLLENNVGIPPTNTLD